MKWWMIDCSPVRLKWLETGTKFHSYVTRPVPLYKISTSKYIGMDHQSTWSPVGCSNSMWQKTEAVILPLVRPTLPFRIVLPPLNWKSPHFVHKRIILPGWIVYLVSSAMANKGILRQLRINFSWYLLLFAPKEEHRFRLHLLSLRIQLRPVHLQSILQQARWQLQ